MAPSAELERWRCHITKGFGVYEKVDEKNAATRNGVNPINTMWTDTDSALEEVRSMPVAREFRSGDRPGSHAGSTSLVTSKAVLFCCSDSLAELWNNAP